MAAGLILRFPSTVGETDYDAVSDRIGWDPRTGVGDWPDGLLSHTAGAADDGWIVMEVWESKDAQAAFMGARLGPALGDQPEPRVIWFDVVATQHRH
jgi:hypothetical protein